MVRWGDNLGLEWWEGDELGVWSLRRPMRPSTAPLSQSPTV